MSPDNKDIEECLNIALEAIKALRRDGSHVHCITNTVAQNFTANILLACGATPSMTVSPAEIEYFTTKSDAVSINLGTLDDQRKLAIKCAIEQCSATDKPFVLDPVMCHVSPPRLELAMDVTAHAPSIIRANKDEKICLGEAGLKNDQIFAVTGETDIVSSSRKQINVLNGHPWLSKITAIGCAQGAIMAALASKTDNRFAAALGALVWVGICGEKAAERAHGPGSFSPAFIDQMHSISLSELRQKARLT